MTALGIRRVLQELDQKLVLRRATDGREFDERRLMDCLTKLGRDVQIVVKAPPRSRKAGRLSIVFA